MLSIYLSIYLPINFICLFHLSVQLSIYLTFHFIDLSVYIFYINSSSILSIYHTHTSAYLSTLFVNQSSYDSIKISIHPSAYLFYSRDSTDSFATFHFIFLDLDFPSKKMTTERRVTPSVIWLPSLSLSNGLVWLAYMSILYGNTIIYIMATEVSGITDGNNTNFHIWYKGCRDDTHDNKYIEGKVLLLFRKQKKKCL